MIYILFSSRVIRFVHFRGRIVVRLSKVASVTEAGKLSFKIIIIMCTFGIPNIFTAIQTVGQEKLSNQHG